MVAAPLQHQSSLRVERSIQITTPVQIAFDSLIEMLGPGSEMPDGTPMPMTLEARPGGRWFRDLGGGAGHLWGHVQVIKPPKLIEIAGPLFIPYPAMSHIQYRLTEADGETTLEFCHRAIGELDPAHCEGVQSGWDHKLKQVRNAAERRT